MFGKIINHLFEYVLAIAKQAKCAIAVITQQSANLACCMVVVNGQRFYMTILSYFFWFIAYCTKIPLFFNKGIVDFNLKSKITLESSLDVIRLNLVNIALIPFSSSCKTTHLTNALQAASRMFVSEKVLNILDFLAIKTPFLADGNFRPTTMFSAMTNNIFQWFTFYPSLIFSVSIGNGSVLPTATLAKPSRDFLKRKLFHGFSPV